MDTTIFGFSCSILGLMSMHQDDLALQVGRILQLANELCIVFSPGPYLIAGGRKAGCEFNSTSHYSPSV